MEINHLAEKYQNWKIQTFPSQELKNKFKNERRPIPTRRPIEIIFATTGKSPEDLKGKAILNVGSGQTHWGLEFTQKYGQIAKKFENFDICFAKQPKLRRLAGKFFLAETVGDAYHLPYNNNSFDLVWTSYALPVTKLQIWQELIRITKPGGEIFMLGGNPTEEIATQLSQELGLKITCQTISSDSTESWAKKAPKSKDFLTNLTGQRFLTVKKPLPNL